MNDMHISEDTMAFKRSFVVGAVYKGRPANGEGGGVVLKFRTFPDGGRGCGL